MTTLRVAIVALCMTIMTGCTVARIVALASLTAAGYSQLSAEDQKQHDSTLVMALNSNHEQSWKNEKNETGGTIVPVKSVQIDGQKCQQVKEIIRVKQNVSEAEFAACRNSDGGIERKKI